MLVKVLTEAEEKAKKEIWFKAEMTHRQFSALAKKLCDSDIENEILNLDYFKNNLTPAQNLQIDEVEMWLMNSWNTENVLFHNKSILENTGQSFCMQWAFPQAYYTTFCSILAYYKSVGFSQMSHSAVLKEFGNLLSKHKYPESISIYTSDSKKSIVYNNITKPNLDTTIELDLAQPETVDNQICQLLKSTREIMSDNRAPKMRFKAKSGQLRKNLTPEMWVKVSDSIGYTTIMDFLYRKRIKANYLDIETFNSAEFKGKLVLNNLCAIVNRLNLINETYIAKAVGFAVYKEMLDKHLVTVNNEIAKSRIATIKTILEA